MKPKIFIGSTKENIEIAYAIQSALSDFAYITPWNQGVFKLSISTLDNLFKALNEYHYALFIFNPDDISIIRDIQKNTVRDNVIFELGLFFGKLGKERVFYLIPNNTHDLHLPTDLIGITAGTYDTTNPNLISAVSPFCNQVRQQIKATFEPTFPLSGYYGLNILSNEGQILKSKEKYSLSAQIPKGSILKIQISNITGPHAPWYYGITSKHNWIIDQFDFDNSMQCFNLIDSEKGDLQVYFAEEGTADILVYFNENLVLKKRITWK